VKIISTKTTIGVPIPCYVGWWLNFKGGVHESHKFWYCCDDLNCNVRMLGEKMVDRSLVLVIWLVQKGINFIQNEVTTLEEASFVYSEQLKYPSHNHFDNESYDCLYQPPDVNSWSKCHNNQKTNALGH